MTYTSVKEPAKTSPYIGSIKKFFELFVTQLNIPVAFPLLVNLIISFVSISALSSLNYIFKRLLDISSLTNSMFAEIYISNLCFSLILYLKLVLKSPMFFENKTISNPATWPLGIIYVF